MENSAIADLTLSKENPSAVLKFNMENQITHELRLTMDRSNISTIVTPTNELVKVSVTINKENSDNSMPVTMPETHRTKRKLGETDSELLEILFNNECHSMVYSVGCVISMGLACIVPWDRTRDYIQKALLGGFVYFSFAIFANLILAWGLITYQGGSTERERRGRERTRRWCRNIVVKYCFLMLYWNTHFRIRKLLPRIKQEDDDAAARLKEEEEEKNAFS